MEDTASRLLEVDRAAQHPILLRWCATGSLAQGTVSILTPNAVSASPDDDTDAQPPQGRPSRRSLTRECHEELRDLIGLPGPMISLSQPYTSRLATLHSVPGDVRGRGRSCLPCRCARRPSGRRTTHRWRGPRRASSRPAQGQLDQRAPRSASSRSTTSPAVQRDGRSPSVAPAARAAPRSAPRVRCRRRTQRRSPISLPARGSAELQRDRKVDEATQARRVPDRSSEQHQQADGRAPTVRPVAHRRGDVLRTRPPGDLRDPMLCGRAHAELAEQRLHAASGAADRSCCPSTASASCSCQQPRRTRPEVHAARWRRARDPHGSAGGRRARDPRLRSRGLLSCPTSSSALRGTNRRRWPCFRQRARAGDRAILRRDARRPDRGCQRNRRRDRPSRCACHGSSSPQGQ